MGYKNVYLKGTNFCGVQRVEMGYCTSKWSTDGNPDIDIQNGIILQLSEITSNIFALILSLTKRLIHLNFCHLFSHRRTWISIYYLPEISHMSSNLTQLKINVETFFDYLYLLDGRLNSLSKLIINVREFELHPKPSYINGWVNIILIIMFP
jgi:hypothetical protein